MSLNNKSLRQRLGRWSQDDTVYRAIRSGALFILFLALTLGIFFALWLWNSPSGETASDLQRAFYTVGGGAVIAALITWALSAVQDTPAEERPLWFCPLMAGGLGLALYLLAYAFLGAYPFGGKTVLMVDLHHQYAPLLSELRHMILEGGDFTYNFNIGMGAAFIPTFAYYLASPLNLLLLFFSESALPHGIF
ncbi:MAG: YfhO family protein, partial [Clostridia bacterium]|nr:YfhO family protein [Clostridia bacterium]